LGETILLLPVLRILHHADDPADEGTRAHANRSAGPGSEATVVSDDGTTQATDDGTGTGTRGCAGRRDG
jgi:hypothetical protein